MVKFKPFEKKFLEQNEIGRLATLSRDGFPHVVPVSYLYHHGNICVAVDYGTRKYQNMLKNKKIALVMDKVNPNQGLLILGKIKIIEKGKKFQRIYRAFNEKFAWVRANPWKEGEAPFIEVQILRKASWGLNE